MSGWNSCSATKSPPIATIPITLLLAVFKFDRMEWAIEKCTELNVTTIVPVIARRTEKHLALAAEKRVERWRRIAREASEQARRSATTRDCGSDSAFGCTGSGCGSAHCPGRVGTRSPADTRFCVNGGSCSHWRWRLDLKAVGLPTNCRPSTGQDGSRLLWARPFSAPKPQPSRPWPWRGRRSGNWR